MNKQDFAVRIPSSSLLVLSINGTLYGFCDAHGDTRDEVLLHLAEVRQDIVGGDDFYDMLWSDRFSQKALQEELDEATDAIRFDFEGEE